MSSTLLERTRAAHEDVERLQRVLVSELKEPPKTHKEGIDQSHKINSILDRIVETSATLEKIYTDSDGSRKDAIASIAGTGPSLYSLFYDRLREIKEYHRKYPNVETERPENLHLPQVDIPFTGEERYGKYIDLNELFTQYVNLDLNGVEKVDYLTYLKQFSDFDSLPAYRLYDKQYKKYTDGLEQYLVSFFKRTQPLLDLDKELQPALKEFETKWSKGEFTDEKSKQEAPTNGSHGTNGTNNNNNNNNNTTPTPTPTPTPAPSTTSTTSTPAPEGTTPSDQPKKKKNKKRKGKKDKPAEPEPVPAPENGVEGMEVDTPQVPKKVNNFDNPLYCRACARLYSKDTVFNAHLTGKKHQQAAADAIQLKKEILLNEVKISKMSELLTDEIDSTRIHVEHKQSLTYDERLKELEEEEEGQVDLFMEEEEDDEPVRMTIKDYPVGWDGKPIPYWLYKLHGLGIEYKCEICGNTSYFGRKAFEKHFQEWRHAHGMACLNIPNTRHFQEITKISDAVALWQKLKEDSKKIQWKPDVEEEYEDTDGHVFNRKTYEDLKRQGLLD